MGFDAATFGLDAIGIYFALLRWATVILWWLGIYSRHTYLGDVRYEILGENVKKLAKFFLIDGGGPAEKFREDVRGFCSFVVVRRHVTKNLTIPVNMYFHVSVDTAKKEYWVERAAGVSAVPESPEIAYFKYPLSLTIGKLATKIKTAI